MKLIIYFLILFIGIFIGYENPELIDKPKKYFKFNFTQLDIGNEAQKNINIDTDKKENIYSANSFKVKLEKIIDFDSYSASAFASYDENKNLIFKIFTQDGFIIDKSNKKKLKLPFTFYDNEEKNGGVKSVFSIKNYDFALISEKKFNCYYASIINLTNLKKIIETDCLPDVENINFAGLGGAYVKFEDKLLISLGTPTHYSDIINNLSLNNNVFGKIIELKQEEVIKDSYIINTFDIFTSGHRNPQGIVVQDEEIYSLEHGPQGGDEFNQIIKCNNYGWPIVSLGTRYGNGNSYKRSHSESGFKEPLFVFLPSIAPSSINICPSNIKEYYKNYNCFIGLSLKEMSIFIFLLKGNRVISLEKIFINKRLRHFSIDKNSATIFFDKDYNFFVTADNDGLYKVNFFDLR